MRKLIVVASLLCLIAVLAWYAWKNESGEDSTAPLTQVPSPEKIAAAHPVTRERTNATLKPKSLVAAVEVSPLRETPRPQASPAWQNDCQRWQQEVIDWLKTQGDADSLTAAALLSWQLTSLFASSDEAKMSAMTLLNKAAQRAPYDPGVAWLAIGACQNLPQKLPKCDPRSYERTLQFAHPRYALGYLSRVADVEARMSATNLANARRGREPSNSERARDLYEMERALLALASSENFSLYTTRFSSLLLQSIRAARVKPPDPVQCPEHQGELLKIDQLIVGVPSSLPLPPISSLVAVCLKPPSDAARTYCMEISRHMRQSDSDYFQSAGLRIAYGLLSATSAEKREVVTLLDQREWLKEQLISLNRVPEQVVRLREETGGEVSAWLALLRENGVPLTRPEGWSQR